MKKTPINSAGGWDYWSEDNFFVHNLMNTGSTTLIFSTVEFIR